jgi:hypothetical protein
MTALTDMYLTIPELAERANVKAQWLREQTHAKDDPLPTTVRGKRPLVLWSAYVDWFENRYGMKGYCRGEENLDIAI